MNEAAKPKFAFWFRYGPAVHAQLFHAMPRIVAELSRYAEVHYFGMRTHHPLPQLIQDHAVIHELPFRVNPSVTRDKFYKTALWLAALPWIARKCRRLGITAVYMDETVPLAGPIARWFFGSNVAMTVADFFLNVYFEHIPFFRLPAKWITALDMAAWHQFPLIFTRAAFTANYLALHGFDRKHIVPVYDPCDFSIYRPTNRAARAQYGFGDNDVVLAHHGILHPNKGNDRIIRALASVRTTLPNLRYLLIGDGPEAPKLRRLVRELQLGDRVHFTGWLPTLDDVNAALNAADIGLVMRIGQESDNFHTTGALVHSMACGLPVLAARLGGVAEIVQEKETGLLFDPSNMDEFLSKLEVLVHDPQLRRHLGDAALKRARELFDIDRVTQQTVNALRKLLPDLSL